MKTENVNVNGFILAPGPTLRHDFFHEMRDTSLTQKYAKKELANNQRVRKRMDQLSEHEMISELTKRWLARESTCLV